MVIDTSALIAILLEESDGPRFIELLSEARDPVISAATLLEASLVMYAKTGRLGVQDLDELLASAGVRCVAVDQLQAQLARTAFVTYGKGNSPASLNYGDCFSYALAAALQRELLFKGADFSQTDIPAAG